MKEGILEACQQGAQGRVVFPLGEENEFMFGSQRKHGEKRLAEIGF
jgi:hypothetical protein